MTKTIKYLKNLSKRIDLTVNIFETNFYGKTTYQVEIIKIDKLGWVRKVEFEVNDKTVLKEVKQNICEALRLRQRRIKKLQNPIK